MRWTTNCTAGHTYRLHGPVCLGTRMKMRDGQLGTQRHQESKTRSALPWWWCPSMDPWIHGMDDGPVRACPRRGRCQPRSGRINRAWARCSTPSYQRRRDTPPRAQRSRCESLRVADRRIRPRALSAWAAPCTACRAAACNTMARWPLAAASARVLLFWAGELRCGRQSNSQRDGDAIGRPPRAISDKGRRGTTSLGKGSMEG